MQSVGNAVANTDQQPTETGQETMYISQGEAARRWHKYKGTISKDIKKGKLQWMTHRGQQRLFIPQLIEQYGNPPAEADTVENGIPSAGNAVVNTDRQPKETSENNSLERVVAAKDELIDELRQQLAEVREMAERERLKTERAEQEADRWHTAFNEIKALPAPAPANVPAVVEQSQRRGLFGLFRKAG